MPKIRVNLANHDELLEIPGLGREQADAIVRFRTEHGPIRDASELARVLGTPGVSAAVAAGVDFEPADSTAPEAPGA
jgi:DNA uptake protein ComE-like DNA-binding protein